MQKILNFIKTAEFSYYFIIGLTATIIDWSVFAMMLNWAGASYPVALIVGYCTAGVTHYTCNKIFTFQCHSKEIASQLSVYIVVTLSALALSLGIMALLVHCFAVNKVILRMMTTLIMLVPNYLLHKHITFSKRLFIQPAQQ